MSRPIGVFTLLSDTGTEVVELPEKTTFVSRIRAQGYKHVIPGDTVEILYDWYPNLKIGDKFEIIKSTFERMEEVVVKNLQTEEVLTVDGFEFDLNCKIVERKYKIRSWNYPECRQSRKCFGGFLNILFNWFPMKFSIGLLQFFVC